MCHYRSNKCFINLHLSTSVNISILQHHLISVVRFVSCLNSVLYVFCNIIFTVNYTQMGINRIKISIRVIDIVK